MSNNKKTLGALLEESFHLFTQNIIPFTKVALVVQIPAALLTVFAGLSFQRVSDQADSLLTLQIGFLLAVAYVAMIIFTFLYQIAIVKAIDQTYQNQAVSTGDVYRDSLHLLGSYFGVSILTIVKVLLWSLLLVIPGIIFGIFYSCATMALILDQKKGNQALVFSKKIVAPYFWKFVGNMFVVSFIYLIVFTFINVLVSLVFGNVTTGQGTMMTSLGMILASIAGVIVGIYVIVFFYLLYQDLKANVEAVSKGAHDSTH